jgi:hypothetical protein
MFLKAMEEVLCSQIIFGKVADECIIGLTRVHIMRMFSSFEAVPNLSLLTFALSIRCLLVSSTLGLLQS